MTAQEEKQVRDALATDCARIAENSQHTATAHFIAADTMAKIHRFVLGPIPIILGAVGGWKWLGESGAPTARRMLAASICSLLAGIAGSLLAFWNLAETHLRHIAAGTAFKSLEHDARRAHEVHSLIETCAEFRARVDALGERYNKANETSVPTSEWSFEQARRKIKRKVFQTEADKRSRRSKSP
jgi:hypothetical protein